MVMLPAGIVSNRMVDLSPSIFCTFADLSKYQGNRISNGLSLYWISHIYDCNLLFDTHNIKINKRFNILYRELPYLPSKLFVLCLKSTYA